MLKDKKTSDLKRARIFEKIAVCDKQLCEGSKDELSLYELFSATMFILNQKNI
jgi:hypothetical protein